MEHYGYIDRGFARELFAVFWILIFFWWFFLAALGLALSFRCLTILKEERKTALPILIPLIAVLAFWRAWSVDGWGDQIWFAVHRPEFEKKLTLIQTGKLPKSGRVPGLKYQCDEENPRIVSFVEVDGIRDNTTAFVYDPTDSVLEIDGVKRDSFHFNKPKRQVVKKMFGDDMLWAKSLGHHWYRCGFN